MAELKDYRNSDFSLTVNNRMHGIELRFVKKMSEEQIESSFGYFPVEEAFSKDILLANGYKTLVAKGPFVESSVSEISNAVKERLDEQNISTNHIDSHISFTGVKPNVNKNTVNGYCD